MILLRSLCFKAKSFAMILVTFRGHAGNSNYYIIGWCWEKYEWNWTHCTVTGGQFNMKHIEAQCWMLSCIIPTPKIPTTISLFLNPICECRCWRDYHLYPVSLFNYISLVLDLGKFFRDIKGWCNSVSSSDARFSTHTINSFILLTNATSSDNF